MSEHLPGHGTQGGGTPLHRSLHALCTALAGVGALIIFGSAVVVTGSVISSTLGFGAFRGEFELVELACAACASLFLPLCQLTKGHVMVDVFTGWLPGRANRAIDALWTAVFAAVWALLCWRLFHGLIELHGYGDRTMLLRAPVWWAYVPAVLGTGLSALVAVYMVVADLRAGPALRGDNA
ncbi:TRAP transporter small permease [Poseidonocella sedimentorum]|uniref:TRAP transporter small permease protein n=1 Tax=Poseidonocella sedimentorum TaxID=871652 RepID=A0A1I6E5W1_9RHOB|nr:TRAP transporter small permease [Poseidonocella sedimentorum]SFR13134.1 TRAP-type C4-dicarboxylate transport system, small permease component [Poseidonocella sedimentorum]